MKPRLALILFVLFVTAARYVVQAAPQGLHDTHLPVIVRAPEPSLAPSQTSVPTVTPLPCQVVRFKDLINVTATGNSISKSGGTNGAWDAGAISEIQSIGTDLIASARPTSTYGLRAFGVTNANNDPSLEQIRFAWYLDNETLRIYESGVPVQNPATGTTAFGSYTPGDVLQIRVLGFQVTYSKNDEVLYTSQRQGASGFFLDTSIATLGASLDEMYLIVNPCGTTPTPTVTPATPTVTPTPSPSPTSTRTPTLNVVNPSFEEGPGVGWEEAFPALSSSVIRQATAESGPAYDGQWMAWLGGDKQAYGRLFQTQVTVPPDKPYFTYWYRATTNESECPFPRDDTVTVNVGNLYRTHDVCDTAKITQDWQRVSTNLSAYAGQALEIRFQVSTGPAPGSTFFVDNVHFGDTP